MHHRSYDDEHYPPDVTGWVIIEVITANETSEVIQRMTPLNLALGMHIRQSNAAHTSWGRWYKSDLVAQS